MERCGTGPGCRHGIPAAATGARPAGTIRALMEAPPRAAWLRPCIAVPVALGAVLRLAHFGFLAARDPLFTIPVVDSLFHANEALRILDAGWLLPGSAAYYKGPLYSYLLAVLIALFGRTGGIVVGRLVSVGCGIVVVALVARAGERLGGRAGAWGAGLAAAFSGTAIFFDAVLLPVSLTSLLLLLAATRLDLARTLAPERRWRALAAAGVLLGLVSLVRADGLLAVMAASLWAGRAARQRAWDDPRPWRAAALVLVPALLVVLPATARNYLVARDPVLISWNGGINLYMGNDPGFDQASGNWNPDLAWMRLYDTPSELGATRGADHQRFFLRQALLAAVDHPSTTLRLLGNKLLLFVSAYEIANNQRFEDAARHSPVLAVLLRQGPRWALPFGLLAPLLAAGLALGDRRGWNAASPWLALAAAWVVTPILFFNTARFRLPAIALLLAPSAAGWARLPAALRGKERRRLVLAAGLGIAVVVLAAATIPGSTQLPPSEELHLADAAAAAGRPDEALAWRRRAVERDPHDVLARIRLADTLRVQKACEEAIPQYRQVIENETVADEWRLAAIRSTARCYAALGRFDEAAAWFRRYLEADPDHPRTGARPDFHLRGVPPLAACRIRLDLADTLRKADRRAEAAAEYAEVGRACGEADRLASRAQAGLRALASGSLEPPAPMRDGADEDARERPR